MPVNHIKIRIEGQLKNQTNYFWNNVRLIYIDTLKLSLFNSKQKAIINDLKMEFENLEDPWERSGIPDRVKKEKVLNNLKKLDSIL